MLLCASKAVFKRTLFLTTCAVAIGFITTSAARAEVTFSGSIGADVWQTPQSPARYLPNYSLPEGKSWHQVNPWVRGTVRSTHDTYVGTLTLTAQGQASQVYGGQVDRLDADLSLTPTEGVRVGVLPYRTSWCRTYDSSSPWIGEPDAFCRFHDLNELAQGAFGAQVYHSDLYEDWLIDAMAGAYRPMVDGQSDKLGPYTPVGPDAKHHKMGAGVNALHLPTGVHLRLSWLNTKQHQDSDTGGYQRQLDYDTIYAAAEGNVSKSLLLRASVSAYIGSQNNPANPFKWDGRSTTLEAVYRPAKGHTLALAYSKYINLTTYALEPHNQSLRVPSLSVAWRFDLPEGFYGTIQGTRSEDTAVSRKGVTTERAGNAIGLRIGKNF